jgi:hypothetical protein
MAGNPMASRKGGGAARILMQRKKQGAALR